MDAVVQAVRRCAGEGGEQGAWLRTVWAGLPLKQPNVLQLLEEAKTREPLADPFAARSVWSEAVLYTRALVTTLTRTWQQPSTTRLMHAAAEGAPAAVPTLATHGYTLLPLEPPAAAAPTLQDVENTLRAWNPTICIIGSEALDEQPCYPHTTFLREGEQELHTAWWCTEEQSVSIVGRARAEAAAPPVLTTWSRVVRHCPDDYCLSDKASTLVVAHNALLIIGPHTVHARWPSGGLAPGMVVKFTLLT